MVEFSDLSHLDLEKRNLIGKASFDEAEAIYNETVGCLRQMYENISQGKELDLQEVRRIIEKLVNTIDSTEDKIVFLTTHIYLKDYLLYHSVNVSILAIKIGMYLKYPHQLLVDLGVMALLHGMDGSEEENDRLRVLEKGKFIQQYIQTEQRDEEFIKEILSIIAVLDVYESLTHARAYRDRFIPYVALTAIISASDEVFNPKIVKDIINVFTIYPLGSVVRLNSEEVAQVIRINRESPLRPEVLILTDSQGKKIEEKKTIDLAARPNIYIKEVA